MSFPHVPAIATVEQHFALALQAARQDDNPYRHWNMDEVLPEALAVGVLVLPIAPLHIDDTHGVRDTDNSKRTFFTPQLQADFPTCAVFAEAMQRPRIAPGNPLGDLCPSSPNAVALVTPARDRCPGADLAGARSAMTRPDKSA